MADRNSSIEAVNPLDVSPATLLVASLLVHEATSQLDRPDDEPLDTLDPESLRAIVLGGIALELTDTPGITMAEAVEELIERKGRLRGLVDRLKELEAGVDPEIYTKAKRVEQLKQYCSDGDLAISSLKKGEIITIEYINSRGKKAIISVSRNKDDEEKETSMDDLVVVNVTQGKKLESNFHNLEEGDIIYIGYLDGGDLTSRLLRDSYPAWVLAQNIRIRDDKPYRSWTKKDESFTLNQIYYGLGTSIPLFPPRSEQY